MQDFVFYSKEFFLEKLAEKEKMLGNNEVVLCRNFTEKELIELKKQLGETKFPVKFFSCFLLLNSNSKELNKFKNKTDFIGVLGGSVQLNNFAVSSKIDFLIQPCVEGRLVFDTATARLAKENNTKILIPFSQFLHANETKKVSLGKNYCFFLKIAKKFKLNPRVISFAAKEKELRSVKDLQAFKGFLEKKFESVIK
ncbi:hypothetical protein KKG83_00745 [Candidatus Micrarchaeota archaeon]|nr:hypothetical protein [Candidatus Micrarchaeota archaeon]